MYSTDILQISMLLYFQQSQIETKEVEEET